MKKTALTAIVAMLTFIGAAAQTTMNVKLKNGELHQFPTENVEIITFSEDNSLVDLGLSVRWASCNLGASQPWENGDYFAYGETAPKENYTFDTYTHGDILGCDDDILPPIAGTKLDAATAILGEGWRMPTAEEVKELHELCEWTSVNIEDVWVVRVTGPNGNCIYLPYAGRFVGNKILEKGTKGIYRYSKERTGGIMAAILELAKNYNDELFYHYIDIMAGIEHGFSIRPVHD